MRWERGAWDPGNHGVGADIDPPPGFPSFLPPLVTVGVRNRRLTSLGWTKHWLHLGLLLRSPYYYWSFGASMWLKEPFLGGDWELCDQGEWIKPIWTWNWSETKTGPIWISWNFHWRVTSPCWPCSIASSSLIFSSTRSPSFSALKASSSSSSLCKSWYSRYSKRVDCGFQDSRRLFGLLLDYCFPLVLFNLRLSGNLSNLFSNW